MSPAVPFWLGHTLLEPRFSEHYFVVVVVVDDDFDEIEVGLFDGLVLA